MSCSLRFNTDDGIRRAAICGLDYGEVLRRCVSIPMTVLGGLQSASLEVMMYINVSSFNTDDGIRRAAIWESHASMNPCYDVSIPMTVLGGLQLPDDPKELCAYSRFQYR